MAIDENEDMKPTIYSLRGEPRRMKGKKMEYVECVGCGNPTTHKSDKCLPCRKRGGKL